MSDQQELEAHSSASIGAYSTATVEHFYSIDNYILV